MNALQHWNVFFFLLGGKSPQLMNIIMGELFNVNMRRLYRENCSALWFGLIIEPPVGFTTRCRGGFRQQLNVNRLFTFATPPLRQHYFTKDTVMKNTPLTAHGTAKTMARKSCPPHVRLRPVHPSPAGWLADFFPSPFAAESVWQKEQQQTTQFSRKCGSCSTDADSLCSCALPALAFGDLEAFCLHGTTQWQSRLSRGRSAFPSHLTIHAHERRGYYYFLCMPLPPFLNSSREVHSVRNREPEPCPEVVKREATKKDKQQQQQPKKSSNEDVEMLNSRVVANEWRTKQHGEIRKTRKRRRRLEHPANKRKILAGMVKYDEMRPGALRFEKGQWLTYATGVSSR